MRHHRFVSASMLLLPALVLAQAPLKTQQPKPLPRTPAPAPAKGAAYCSGAYADDFSALLPKARELEEQVAAYTFCIRTAATYECPSYGADGNLRRTKRRVVAHGTAFAYRQQDGETLLVTNEHVAEWPAVTDAEHPVEEVPLGCKRVADSLKIVDNEKDSFEEDDIPLSRVVSDAQLDVTVLKAKGLLSVLPWKLGRSAGLKERNVVDVRGFPLGVFKATNVGKVISAYDHDTDRDWDHDDFVVDALLSPGNSGSPVFAISCKTGEFELVGIYHAGYTRGSAMNVVVGIDQVRDLMATLKRGTRPRPETNAALDGTARARLATSSNLTLEPYFAFGPTTAAVRVRDDGALLYEILNRDFPFRAYPVVVLEDLPDADPSVFGAPGRVWFGNRHGLKPYPRADLDADTQAQLAKLLEALRQASVASFVVRAADHEASSSKEKFQHTERLEKALQGANASHAEMAQVALELAERFAPRPGDASVELQATLVTPRPEAVTAPPPSSSAVSAPNTSPSSMGQSSGSLQKQSPVAAGGQLGPAKP